MYDSIRIIESLKPKYVIWENVKNLLSQKHRHNFDAYLQALENLGYKNYYKVLDAKDYGIPQNRERIFTISIRNDLNQTFEFPEKQELKLRLKDILEQKVDEKYYLKDYQIENILKSNFTQERKRIQGKDYCDTLCARDWKDPKCVEVNSPIRLGNIYGENKGTSFAGNVWDKEAISPTLTNMQGGNRQPMIVDKINYQGKDIELPCIGASRGRNPENPSEKIIMSPDNDENNSIRTIGYYSPSKHEASRVVDSNGLSPTVKENHGTVTATNINTRIRKLTPKECWRLMGFTDDDFCKAAFKKETSYIEGGLKCNAKLKIVSEKQRHLDMETYALCTTNDILDMETPIQTKWKKSIENENNEKMQNVNIAIEMLEEVEQKECVTNIIKCGENTTILYTLMEELDQHPMAIIELGKEGKANIEKYMKITLEENLNHMKLYTISTLIEQIIKSKIYTCITQKANIQGNIAIIEDCVKNLKMMKLSNLKMEYITRLNSDSMLYKQAGNSIVVNVLEKIFNNLLINNDYNKDKRGI